MLGAVLTNDQGEQFYVRVREEGLKAEVFPTGVFIFRNVPPGRYGIAIDIGYAQFLLEPNGEPLLFDIVGGEVKDLGQIITSLP